MFSNLRLEFKKKREPTAEKLFVKDSVYTLTMNYLNGPCPTQIIIIVDYLFAQIYTRCTNII